MSLSWTRLLFLVALLCAASPAARAHDGHDHGDHGNHGSAAPGPTPTPTTTSAGGSSPTAPTASPSTTVIWVSSLSKSLTVVGTITLVPNLPPSATALAKPNDPKLPERPEANLVAADKVKAYCDKAPKVSAPCAFWKMCQELGDKAPSYVCGTTAIAKYVCDPKDGEQDTENAKDLCADFAAKCTDDKCKGLGWPRWQPSFLYQVASFNMCEFHAKRNEFMTGCDQCTRLPGDLPNLAKENNDLKKLNQTCNSFVLHGEMCSNMPGMGGCRNWREMCSTLPNAGELLPKWCSPDAMAARNITYNATLANQFIVDKAPKKEGSGAAAGSLASMSVGALAAFVLAAVTMM